jgi:hypothetical protein
MNTRKECHWLHTRMQDFQVEQRHDAQWHPRVQILVGKRAPYSLELTFGLRSQLGLSPIRVGNFDLQCCVTPSAYWQSSWSVQLSLGPISAGNFDLITVCYVMVSCTATYLIVLPNIYRNISHRIPNMTHQTTTHELWWWCGL